MAPKTDNRKPSDPTDFGPGMNAAGDVNVMTEEEARVARDERDAFDSAFDNDLDEDNGDDSDLDAEDPLADLDLGD